VVLLELLDGVPDQELELVGVLEELVLVEVPVVVLLELLDAAPAREPELVGVLEELVLVDVPVVVLPELLDAAPAREPELVGVLEELVLVEVPAVVPRLLEALAPPPEVFPAFDAAVARAEASPTANFPMFSAISYLLPRAACTRPGPALPV